MHKPLLEISSEGRKLTVVPHVLVYDVQHGSRFLMFASYVGVSEAVKAVSASILEMREVRYGNVLFRKSYMDHYRRVERAIGLGDTAHGCVYSSYFELGAIEQEKEPEKFNRAMLFAADGDIQTVLANHVIARFGLPHEWSDRYYQIFQKFIQPLIVEVNPAFDEWKHATAVHFTANEEDVIRTMNEALLSYRLVIPASQINGELDPSWSMSEYMLKNATHLAAQLAELKPRHTFDQPLDPALGKLKRIPFPSQAHAIQALVNAYEDPIPEACFLGGDMGSGSAARSVCDKNVVNQSKKS